MKSLLILFLVMAINCFGQKENKEGTIKIKNVTDTTIYSSKEVEQQPQFPGGVKSLEIYLNKLSQLSPSVCNSLYPVTFVVEKDGHVSFVKIKNGNEKECKQKMIQILESMPLWIPGYIKGNPVRVQMYWEFF